MTRGDGGLSGRRRAGGTRPGGVRNGAAPLLLLLVGVLVCLPPAAAQAPAPDSLTRDDLRTLWVRSYTPGRSGDVFLVPEPGFFLADDDPDYPFMHGAPWGYDADIPMVLSGRPWIRAGLRGGPASHEDLGATVTALLGLPPAPAANGRVLEAAWGGDGAAGGRDRAPAVVAVLFLDGFRGDYLERHPDSVPALARLGESGASFRGRVAYLPTSTGVAHTTFVAAATPSRHGIIANNLYDRTSRRESHAFEGASPGNVFGQTLVDRWLGWTWGEAEVAVQGGTYYPAASLAGKGACVTAGHRPRVAFYDEEAGRWVTNEACYAFPDTLADVRAARAWAEAGGRWMGHDISNPSDFRRSAHFARFEGEATRALLGELEPGADDVTDLLLVNWKAGDYVSHKYGPTSAEMWRTVEEVDRQIGLLADALERAAGTAGYVLAVTADHGMPGEPPGAARRVRYRDALADVDRRFDPGGPGVALNLTGSSHQLFLDRARLRELGVGTDEVARFLEGRDWVRAAFTAEEVRSGNVP